jgi:formamidopyrimidine-DNA glycosylase
MPELPEVETVRRGLAPIMEGQRITRVLQRRPNLRFPFPDDLAGRLTGRLIEGLSRRAKYLLWHLEGGQVLIGHLGMSGRMITHQGWPESFATHDHLVLEFSNGWVLRFNDARRFGFLVATSHNELTSHPLLAAIGPEPLSDEFDGAVLAAALAGKRTPIKAALLDQHLVAGLGNIYVCEALWHARISPEREARQVSAAEAEVLARAIKDVLGRAIAAGGSSLRDYVQSDGELGYFQNSHVVYGREGQDCPDCAAGRPHPVAPGNKGCIERIVQSGRSSFYCPVRQL